MRRLDPTGPDVISKVLLRRYAWALALAALSIVLIVGLVVQRRRAQRIEVGLQHAYEAATGESYASQGRIGSSACGNWFKH